jgi:hypothetical protein
VDAIGGLTIIVVVGVVVGALGLAEAERGGRFF